MTRGGSHIARRRAWRPAHRREAYSARQRLQRGLVGQPCTPARAACRPGPKAFGTRPMPKGDTVGTSRKRRRACPQQEIPPQAFRSSVDLPPAPGPRSPRCRLRPGCPRPAANTPADCARIELIRRTCVLDAPLKSGPSRPLTGHPGPSKEQHQYTCPGGQVPCLAPDPPPRARSPRRFRLHPHRPRQRHPRPRPAPRSRVRFPRRSPAPCHGPGTRLDRRRRALRAFPFTHQELKTWPRKN